MPDQEILYLNREVFKFSHGRLPVGHAMVVLETLDGYAVPERWVTYDVNVVYDDEGLGLVCHPVDEPNCRLLIDSRFLQEANPAQECRYCGHELGVDASHVEDRVGGGHAHEHCVEGDLAKAVQDCWIDESDVPRIERVRAEMAERERENLAVLEVLMAEDN